MNIEIVSTLHDPNKLWLSRMITQERLEKIERTVGNKWAISVTDSTWEACQTEINLLQTRGVTLARQGDSEDLSGNSVEDNHLKALNLGRGIKADRTIHIDADRVFSLIAFGSMPTMLNDLEHVLSQSGKDLDFIALCRQKSYEFFNRYVSELPITAITSWISKCHIDTMGSMCIMSDKCVNTILEGTKSESSMTFPSTKWWDLALNNRLRIGGVFLKNMRRGIELPQLLDNKDYVSDYEAWLAARRDESGEISKLSYQKRFAISYEIFGYLYQRFGKSKKRETRELLTLSNEYYGKLEALIGESEGVVKDVSVLDLTFPFEKHVEKMGIVADIGEAADMQCSKEGKRAALSKPHTLSKKFGLHKFDFELLLDERKGGFEKKY